jgi:beta-lactamase class A
MNTRSHNSHLAPLFALCLAIVLFIGIGFVAAKSHITYAALGIPHSVKPTVDQAAQNKLVADIRSILSGGTAGVSIRNLATNETIHINSQQVFDAASTSKIVIASYIYHQASIGALNLDDSVTVTDADIETGTGDLQDRDTPFTESYRDLVKVMMQNSDNTAAHVLAATAGDDKIQAYSVNTLGLKQTARTNNTTTADDMRSAIEAVYTGKIANQTLTNELLSYMVHTEFEDRLPADLPTSATVYHKIGNGIQGDMDDVGIVTYQGQTYAVAIYTAGYDDPAVASTAIAQASKRIFDYFTK